MEQVGTLIVGGGITGLATAAFLGHPDCLLLEAEQELGGYCRSIRRDGFTWDFSGHFFHFRNAELESWLRDRMPGQRVLTVKKRSFISYAGGRVDFPFQKNIHQLPREDFIDCLHDLYLAHEAGAPGPFANFKDMLLARFGRGICERFLFPYNEKLYACDLSALDPDAMGRFFPHASLRDVIRNMRTPDNAGYNDTFTYPEGGAVQYVHALASAVDPARIQVGEAVTAIDLATRTATTTRRTVHYERLVSTMPFPRLLRLAAVPHDASAFTWNKVLVFNLGFDRKGPAGVHWLYVPDRARCFYRVGFYDNIFEADRMSLYVELGFPRDAVLDPEALRERVLADLRAEGIVDDQRLVAHHHVVMDPAYVHINRRSLEEAARCAELLRGHGVHSAGRYGRWTYCSMEDNMLEARALAASFGG
ncbi:MAG: FAD-dependent oxidoreductase [Deltaproteobacteria bacterium]|nr:FAD-dependent oxidoreductase [Deltaproteobacteria bacterium]